MLTPLEVSYFHRAQGGGHSLEEVFAVVRDHLPANAVRSVVHVASLAGANPLALLRNGFEARHRESGGVNHITGDVLYLGLFLDGTRTVLTIPDVGVLHRKRGWRRTALQTIWFDGPERRASAVTTISQAARRDICETLGWPLSRIEVIPVAISPRFRLSPKGRTGCRPRILQVGTSGNKNLLRVAKALSGLRVTLSVIGKLDSAQKRALAASDIPFEERYALSPEEVLEQYETCDLVVFASTYEGFGMPILEAQAVGRPVVTSNCSSMPEVAGDGAQLVDPFDVESIRNGVRAVLEDPRTAERLVEAGLENGKRFCPRAVAEQYLSVYQRIVDDARA